MSRDLNENLLCTVAGSRRPTAAVFAKRIGKALALGLFFFALAAPPIEAQVCTNDLQGPDDEPGQKDLSQFCATGSCGTGSRYTWNFDDTNWPGGNTGDSCALFDTDGDGNANRAVCVTIIGGLAGAATIQPGNPKCYTCTDGRPDRCTGSVQQASCTSSCTVSPLGVDPFATHPEHDNNNDCDASPGCFAADAQVNCCIQPADDGGNLLDVCSYPSQQPNSDPSDCVILPDQCNSAADCNDNNPCTVDECVADSGPDFCRHTPASATTVCRAATGECDAAETCDGTTTTCPADAKKAAGTTCGDDGNACTTDVCDGTTDICQHPAGNGGTVCRAPAGDCDMAETCTGVTSSCPPDVFQPPTVTCRAPAGACDLAENCTGSTAHCPADFKAPSGTLCRGPAGVCDVAEVCDGQNDACPADAFQLAGTPCGGSTLECDALNTCNGSGSCTDNKDPAGTECNPAGPNPTCDPADVCDGTNNACAPVFAGTGTACGGSDAACDALDTCNGTGACTDNKDPAGTQCNPAGANPTCDPADVCDGFTNACAPVFAGTGTACGGSAAECDALDTCNGTGACTDNKDPAGTECNPAGLDPTCDPADVCDGTNNACAPVFAEAGTACGSRSDTECTDPDTCDRAGSCQENNARDDTPCDDEKLCTVGEKCTDGLCGGGELNSCDDNNDCTEDACNLGTDMCENVSTNPPCEGKMTGGGQIIRDSNKDKRSFGFNAKGAAQVEGGASGHFNYVNHLTGVKINGPVTFIYYAIPGTNGGEMKFRVTTAEGCNYDVTTKDEVEPGSKAPYDDLTVQYTSGPCFAETTGGPQPLKTGNIQWHNQ